MGSTAANQLDRCGACNGQRCASPGSGAQRGLRRHDASPSGAIYVDQHVAEPHSHRHEAPLVNSDFPLQTDLQAVPFRNRFQTPKLRNCRGDSDLEEFTRVYALSIKANGGGQATMSK